MTKVIRHINTTNVLKAIVIANKDLAKFEKADQATRERIENCALIGAAINATCAKLDTERFTKKALNAFNEEYPENKLGEVLKGNKLAKFVATCRMCAVNTEAVIKFVEERNKKSTGENKLSMSSLKTVYDRNVTRVDNTEAVTSDTDTTSSGSEPEAKNDTDSLTSKLRAGAKFVEDITKGTDISPLEFVQALEKLYKQTPAERALNVAK